MSDENIKVWNVHGGMACFGVESGGGLSWCTGTFW